jgi:hypothetical protein
MNEWLYFVILVILDGFRWHFVCLSSGWPNVSRLEDIRLGGVVHKHDVGS